MYNVKCIHHCEYSLTMFALSGCDTGCPKISSSICGSDGKFYSNQCVLDKINCILGGEKIKNLYKGVCEGKDKNYIV